MPGPGQPTCMCGMAHNPHENGRSTLRTNFSTVLGLILGLCPTNERRRYNVTPSLIGWAQTKNQSYSLYDWQVTAGPACSHDAYPGWQRSLDSELYDLGLNLGIDKISITFNYGQFQNQISQLRLLCTMWRPQCLRIHASVNTVTICSGNDLSHFLHQAITQIRTDLLPIGPSGANFGDIIKMHLNMWSAKCQLCW